MKVCGAAAIFSAITMCDFKIATEIIQKRKMARYFAWMNDLDSYSSFALLENYWSNGVLKGEIDLSDIRLDRAEVNFQ